MLALATEVVLAQEAQALAAQQAGPEELAELVEEAALAAALLVAQVALPEALAGRAAAAVVEARHRPRISRSQATRAGSASASTR